MKLTATHLALVLALGAVVIGVADHLNGSASSPPARAAAAAPAVLSAADLCKRDLTKLIAFRDPDSVRIGDVDADTKPGDDGLTAVLMMVNAKNGFGGYTGDKQYGCEADVAAQKVVFLAPSRP